ncbi:hypothetical protein NHF45_06685 [Maricaulaceae bacterium NA33B04]|nr:hypothetical protein [Maricaulaceae bacterium NA33B04]
MDKYKVWQFTLSNEKAATRRTGAIIAVFSVLAKCDEFITGRYKAGQALTEYASSYPELQSGTAKSLLRDLQAGVQYRGEAKRFFDLFVKILDQLWTDAEGLTESQDAETAQTLLQRLAGAKRRTRRDVIKSFNKKLEKLFLDERNVHFDRVVADLCENLGRYCDPRLPAPAFANFVIYRVFGSLTMRTDPCLLAFIREARGDKPNDPTDRGLIVRDIFWGRFKTSANVQNKDAVLNPKRGPAAVYTSTVDATAYLMPERVAGKPAVYSGRQASVAEKEEGLHPIVLSHVEVPNEDGAYSVGLISGATRHSEQPAVWKCIVAPLPKTACEQLIPDLEAIGDCTEQAFSILKQSPIYPVASDSKSPYSKARLMPDREIPGTWYAAIHEYLASHNLTAQLETAEDKTAGGPSLRSLLRRSVLDPRTKAAVDARLDGLRDCIGAIAENPEGLDNDQVKERVLDEILSNCVEPFMMAESSIDEPKFRYTKLTKNELSLFLDPAKGKRYVPKSSDRQGQFKAPGSAH